MVGIVEKVALYLTGRTMASVVGFELDIGFDFGVCYPYNLDNHTTFQNFSFLFRLQKLTYKLKVVCKMR